MPNHSLKENMYNKTHYVYTRMCKLCGGLTDYISLEKANHKWTEFYRAIEIDGNKWQHCPHCGNYCATEIVAMTEPPQ